MKVAARCINKHWYVGDVANTTKRKRRRAAKTGRYATQACIKEIGAVGRAVVVENAVGCGAKYDPAALAETCEIDHDGAVVERATMGTSARERHRVAYDKAIVQCGYKSPAALHSRVGCEFAVIEGSPIHPATPGSG